MMRKTLPLLGGGTRDRWDVAGRIDDRVEHPAGERGEIAAAVSDQLLDLREEVCVCHAAVEQRQVVPARQGGVDERSSEELRPAEDENSQWNLCTARHTASAPNSSAPTGIRSSAAWISLVKSNSSGRRIGRNP